MGCVRVGEVTKGGQLIKKSGTRVDGYLHHEQESWFSKKVKKAGNRNEGWQAKRADNTVQGAGLTRAISRV